MPSRVASTRFVGRQAELAELGALLARAADGRAQMAFVTGESGVGKTRLVDELARLARDRGARFIGGDCVELGESELPYAPIVSALRPLVRAGDPALEALGPARRMLAGLLPELGAGDEAWRPGGETTPQGRVFEVLLSLVDRLGAGGPLVLAIEDLHWADRSTRDFVVYLSRVLCRERVLVVATYRSDELHRRHPLRPVVAELERNELAHRIALHPFSRAELDAQLEDILGATPDAGLVDRLLARSEGNPLFAEELLAAGRDGRGELPPTLRDALMLRVEALPAVAQELLRVVAAGQRVDHELLRAVSGVDGRPLREALREAVGQQLLIADEDGRYAFRHALLREAVHDDLLPGEHAELHLALGDALERRGAGSLADETEIAHHFAAAGERPRALSTAVRAAASAEAAHANGEAAAMLERALELWDHVEDPETPAGSDHVTLLRRAAQAHGLAGDFHRMRVLLQHALDEVDRAADPHRAAALLERLGRARWELGKGEEALAAYAEGLALLPDDRPCPERATLLAAQGRALMLAGRFDEGAARSREAIDVARAAGARAAEDGALNTLGVCLAGLGDAAGGERALRESMAIARADGRLEDLSRGYVNLSDVLFLVGRPRQAREVAGEGLEEMRGGGACRWLSLQLAEVDFHLGDWATSGRLLDADAKATSHGTAHLQQLVRRAELVLGQGDHREAIRLLEDARDRAQRSIEPQWHAPIAALLAQAYRRDRRLDDARAAVEAGLERVRPGATQDIGRLTRVAAAGVAVEADRAQLARDLARPDDAAAAVARAGELAALARDAVSGTASGSMAMSLAHVADAEANLLRAEGRPDPALYALAAERWDAVERPYSAALARHRQAEALAAAGERDAAAAAAAAAHDTAERLGAGWLAQELESLVRRARLPVPGRAEAAATEEPDDALGLTPREREVLTLLARGCTNREIGETLFMAEKTASVHVSRILAKLDVRSRTEAAALAHRLGIAA